MHSSRMRTGRSLTVCCSLLPGGGVSAWSWGGVCLVLGGCLPGLGGVSAWSWGCLPGPGGFPCPGGSAWSGGRGVSAWSRKGVSAWSQGVCLVRGVSAWSGGCSPCRGGVCLVWGGFCLVLGGSPCPGEGLPGPGGGSAWSWGGFLPARRGLPGPGGPARRPPPVNRITDTCKNITLATTSLRPVKIV